jgi:hypothetical protein
MPQKTRRQVKVLEIPSRRLGNYPLLTLSNGSFANRDKDALELTKPVRADRQTHPAHLERTNVALSPVIPRTQTAIAPVFVNPAILTSGSG